MPKSLAPMTTKPAKKRTKRTARKVLSNTPDEASQSRKSFSSNLKTSENSSVPAHAQPLAAEYRSQPVDSGFSDTSLDEETEDAIYNSLDKRNIWNVANKDSQGPPKHRKGDRESLLSTSKNEQNAFYRSALKIGTALAILFALMYLKFREEAYVRGSNSRVDVDYYGALNLTSSATAADIRKAYRELSIKFHPDRTRETAAVERFRRISDAYAVLGDPTAKKFYDNTAGGTLQAIPSLSQSIETPEFYVKNVLQGPDVWIIQVYKDMDQFCITMASHWDKLERKYGSLVKFARINGNNKSVLAKLHTNVRFFPTIFAYDGKSQEYHVYSQSGRPTDKSLNKFLLASFPSIVVEFNPSTLRARLTNSFGKPLIIFATPTPLVTFALRALGHKYSGVFDFGILPIEELRKNEILQVQVSEEADVIAVLIEPMDQASRLSSGLLKPQLTVELRGDELNEPRVTRIINMCLKLVVPVMDSTNAELVCKVETMNRHLCLAIPQKLVNVTLQNSQELFDRETANFSLSRSIRNLGESHNANRHENSNMTIQVVQVPLPNLVRNLTPTKGNLSPLEKFWSGTVKDQVALLDFHENLIAVVKRDSLDSLFELLEDNEIFFQPFAKVAAKDDQTLHHIEELFTHSPQPLWLKFYRYVRTLF